MAYAQNMTGLLFRHPSRLNQASNGGVPVAGESLRSFRPTTLRQENEHLRQELARHVRMEQRLRRARMKAEADNRMKSEFFANISHEVRLPVNSIIGLTELLLDMKLSAEQREPLNLVKISADALLAMVGNLLDLSRIEAGCLALENIPLTLRDRLGDTLKTLALSAHRKGLDLVCDIAPEVPEQVVGDPVRLCQIVGNLVGNAIKFTARGSVILRVRRTAHGDGRARLHFAVIDTGIGIRGERRERIFAPFVQADISTARLYGGSGLGLSIASRLVAKMGGAIRVESEPDQGSVFQFSLDFAVPVETGDEPPAPDFGTRRALVVAGHPVRRRWLANTLRHWHFRVEEAADAAGAMDALTWTAGETHGYDLTLLDEAAAPRLCGTAAMADTAMIVLGSLLPGPDPAGGREGVGPGGALRRHLTKPIKQSELLAAVVELMNERERRSETRTPHAMAQCAADRALDILVVDDDPISRQVARHVLERAGHRVALADSAAQALLAIERNRPDLVLMDLQLPDHSGFEATRIIRRRERARGGHLPVVALTARTLVGDARRCLRAGMDDCLAKPIQPGDLLRVVGQSARSPVYRMDATVEWPAPSADEVIDRGDLFGRIGNETRLLVEIADLFVRRSPILLDAGRKALARRDPRGFGEATHTLAGMFHSLAARAALRAAERLGRIDIEAAPEEAAGAYRQLEREAGRLKVALRRLAEEMGLSGVAR